MFPNVVLSGSLGYEENMALGNMRSRSKKSVPPKLMITSMMEDIELPKSTAKMDHTETIKLVLTQNSLHLNNDLIARVRKGRVIGLDAQNPKASVLYQRLEKQSAKAVKKSNEKQRIDHILLLCDKRHSFKTINDIVKTAALAGYPNFQFAVLKE
jgi:biopolymer transport protein ExbD